MSHLVILKCIFFFRAGNGEPSTSDMDGGDRASLDSSGDVRSKQNMKRMKKIKNNKRWQKFKVCYNFYSYFLVQLAQIIPHNPRQNHPLHAWRFNSCICQASMHHIVLWHLLLALYLSPGWSFHVHIHTSSPRSSFPFHSTWPLTTLLKSTQRLSRLFFPSAPSLFLSVPRTLYASPTNTTTSSFKLFQLYFYLEKSILLSNIWVVWINVHRLMKLNIIVNLVLLFVNLLGIVPVQ